MSDSSQQIEIIKLAARLYYIDGLSQTDIARTMEISQAKVSRLLQLSRERGVVRISVDEFQPRDLQLEEQLCSTHPVHRAIVIRNVSEMSSPTGIRRSIGYFGAPEVGAWFQPGDVIGVTGGRTLAALVRRIKAPATARNLRVVQLMGSIGAAVNESDAVELCRHLANVFGGSCYALNTPAFTSTPASRANFLEQDQVKSVWKLYGEMTLAMVGIGTLRDSAFIDRGVVTAHDLRRLGAAGAVGEICGRYYDSAGRECETDFRHRVVSIDLKQLKRIPNVVGVTAGADRAEAVAVALRSGLIQSLVVDDACARAVLQQPFTTGSKRKASKVAAQKK